MRCSARDVEDFETVFEPRVSPEGNTADAITKTASTAAEVAMRSAQSGDSAAALNALRPYLVDSDGDFRPNLSGLSRIRSDRVRADLLLAVGLLMDLRRRYREAVDLMEAAVTLYECERDDSATANAYHWLSVASSHTGDFRQAVRYESKRFDLTCQAADREKSGCGQGTSGRISAAVAASRVWLATLALKQGDVAKATAELSAAQELLLALDTGTTPVDNPQVWGDLYLGLGKLYFSLGKSDDAVNENGRALTFYKQAGQTALQVRAHIGLARIYIRKAQEELVPGADLDKAKRELDTAREIWEGRLSGNDLRSACWLSLAYSWLSLAKRDGESSEGLARTALKDAQKLGSPFLLAESHRALADALTLRNKPEAARNSLEVAMKFAVCAGRSKTVAAVLLSCAHTYRGDVGCDRARFDEYLDRFLELKSKQRFESRYLDDLFTQLHRERPAVAPTDAFYFSCDDLMSTGYDDGLSKFLVWAIHAAQRTAHGDVKEIQKVLHFRTLTRAYKYIKLARAVEIGKRESALRINKTHTIRPRPAVGERVSPEL